MKDEELKKKLSPLQYRVTQKADTDARSRTSIGTTITKEFYVDSSRANPYLGSLEKFDSARLASFFSPLVRENLIEKSDFEIGVERTEVRTNKHVDLTWVTFSPTASTNRVTLNCIKLGGA